MTEEQKQEAVTEARRLICSALSDVGAACERLRKLDEALPMNGPDAWEDVISYVTSAGEVLGEVTILAAKLAEMEEAPCN